MSKANPGIDVLNLEWTSYPSRDRQMATLVCNYLRIQGYSVVEGSVFKGIELLEKYRPKLFFITNTIGAPVNARLMRYAKKHGAFGVSLISEGIFKKGYETQPDFFWGWNKDKKLHEDLHLQWSETSRNITLKMHPQLADKIKVSGAVGFDVFKIAMFKTKKEFLETYNKDKYDRVIGIAGWDFGPCYPGNPRYDMFLARLGEAALERYRGDAKILNQIHLDAIKSHPEILFLIKEHPGALCGRQSAAAEGTENFENVLYLKNEESLADCLNISDIWLSYESTTALEAWMLNKPTALTNPTGIDIPFRDDIHKGSPNLADIQALNNAISSFYDSGMLPGFSELEKERKRIIKTLIQWDDGLNHVRAGNAIIELLETSPPSNWSPPDFHDHIQLLSEKTLRHLAPLIAPISKRFAKYNSNITKWNDAELERFRNQRLEEQKSFYKKDGTQISNLYYP